MHEFCDPVGVCVTVNVFRFPLHGSQVGCWRMQSQTVNGAFAWVCPVLSKVATARFVTVVLVPAPKTVAMR